MGTISDISGDIHVNLEGYCAMYKVCSREYPKRRPSSWFPTPKEVETAIAVGAECQVDHRNAVVDVLIEETGLIHIEFCDTYEGLTTSLEEGINALLKADPKADIDVMDVCIDYMKTADKWTVEHGKLIHQVIR